MLLFNLYVFACKPIIYLFDRMNNNKRNCYYCIDFRLMCFTLLLILPLQMHGSSHCLTAILESQNDAICCDSLYRYSPDVRYILPDIVLYENETDVVHPRYLFTPIVQPFLPQQPSSGRPMLAVKSNLLFDAFTALNLEIEVPIKERWSVAAEWMFPWWQHTRNHHTSRPWRLEALIGTAEGRYWWGNRQKYGIMQGWFAGVFIGAGIYDVQWKAKGYQGDYFVMAGASAGYAHRIARNLSLEYSLGVGYFNTRYRHYKSIFGPDCRWHPIQLKSGRYQYFGPLRAKVSLVWMLNFNSKKGGSR